jgi:hypothetical protein
MLTTTLSRTTSFLYPLYRVSSFADEEEEEETSAFADKEEESKSAEKEKPIAKTTTT